MIDGVVLKPLKIIPDPRGNIMHMLKSDAEGFAGFGEAYFTCIEPNAVKAWRKHTRATMQIAVPHGLVQIVLFDDRPESPTKGEIADVTLGPSPEENYNLLIVPPGIWNGFRGESAATSIIANCSSLLHDPDEAERREVDDLAIPYTWPRDRGND